MARGRKKLTATPAKIDAPTPEQLAKGGYKRGFVMHAESATETMTHKSNHDPVERWKHTDPPRLEPHQIAAIELCQALWERVGIRQSVTASYGERIAGSGNAEHNTNAQLDASRQLHRIMGYFDGLGKWWSVFELVCRHGEPAGTAGSRLGYGDRGGADRAHTVVCFVADKIAEQERL